MLNDTVIKNISLQSEENVNSKKIEFVSEMCDLSFVENLSEKWNTVIGEKNTQLSSGQIQRISLARAIYNDQKYFSLTSPQIT